MSIDGRSLVPFMHDTNLRTRRPILFESFVETNDVEENGGGPAVTPASVASRPGSGAGRASTPRRAKATASIAAPPKNYYGIRLGPYKYIEWPDGEKELYDINKDPYELNNRIKDRNLSPIRSFLHGQLVRLETCVGRTCQEPAPKFPLTRNQQRQLKRERERREHQHKHPGQGGR